MVPCGRSLWDLIRSKTESRPAFEELADLSWWIPRDEFRLQAVLTTGMRLQHLLSSHGFMKLTGETHTFHMIEFRSD